MIQVVKIYDLLLSPSCAIIIFVELSPESPDSHRDVTLPAAQFYDYEIWAIRVESSYYLSGL